MFLLLYVLGYGRGGGAVAHLLSRSAPTLRIDCVFQEPQLKSDVWTSAGCALRTAQLMRDDYCYCVYARHDACSTPKHHQTLYSTVTPGTTVAVP